MTGDNAPNGRPTCGSFHESGGMNCVRPQGHDGHCWCKWEAITGSPGYARRAEWSMQGGFLHIRYVQRKLVNLPQQTQGSTFYGGNDDGEEWKRDDA